MQVTTIHPPEKNIDELKKALLPLNIKLDPIILKPHQPLDPIIYNAAIILIITDPPEYHSIELLSEIKKQNDTISVLMLDNVENSELRQKCLAEGAQGYFTEPFHYQDLALSIKKLLSKKETTLGHKWLRAFDVWLNMEHRIAKRSQKTVSLCNKEFSLLEFFVLNRGKVLSRNLLLEYVWDRNANFASNTLDVHINRLRRKIDRPFQEKLIHTVPCVGYVFGKRKQWE